MKALRRHNSGFTLLEMIIAVAIFAIMMTMAYQGLNHTIKVGSQVHESNTLLAELQFGVSYMSRDWMQVSARKIRNQYGDEENNIVIEDNSIKFTRSGWRNLLQRKRSELQRVQYLLEDDKLIRRHWLSLDQGIGEESFSAVLLNNVESLEIYFIDASEKPIESWPDQFNSQDKSPVALKVAVSIKQLGEIYRIMEIPSGVL